MEGVGTLGVEGSAGVGDGNSTSLSVLRGGAVSSDVEVSEEEIEGVGGGRLVVEDAKVVDDAESVMGVLPSGDDDVDDSVPSMILDSGCRAVRECSAASKCVSLLLTLYFHHHAPRGGTHTSVENSQSQWMSANFEHCSAFFEERFGEMCTSCGGGCIIG